MKHTFSLRLSPVFAKQLREAAKAEGLTLSHYVDIAVAEKMSREKVAGGKRVELAA